MQTCKQVVTSVLTADTFFSHCLYQVVGTSLERAVRQFVISVWEHQTVTRLTTQECKNIVMSMLHRVVR